MRKLFLFVLASACLAGTAAAAEYRISLIDSGMRDYYCTVTVQIENRSADTLSDLNGFVLSLAGEDEVGRSRAVSFLNVAPGVAASAVFETPNAPCAEITGYRFVVGACRVGPKFHDQTDCAVRIDVVGPFVGVVAR